MPKFQKSFEEWSSTASLTKTETVQRRLRQQNSYSSTPTCPCKAEKLKINVSTSIRQRVPCRILRHTESSAVAKLPRPLRRLNDLNEFFQKLLGRRQHRQLVLVSC